LIKTNYRQARPLAYLGAVMDECGNNIKIPYKPREVISAVTTANTVFMDMTSCTRDEDSGEIYSLHRQRKTVTATFKFTKKRKTNRNWNKINSKKLCKSTQKEKRKLF
jgi:hypothetical protein